MVNLNKSPWLSRWEVVDSLSGGGQGTTSIVRLRGSDDEPRYVLKILKSQKDAGRRARMYKEVAALRTLKHPLIPAYTESNADQFDDLSVPLYLVSEYVPGPTIAQFTQDKPIDYGAAEQIFLRLLDVVGYCHGREVVHRDIKPDNILLRDSNPETPVLLDFGLSFNEQLHAGAPSTSPNEQLGNRFLALPELQIGSELRTDPRSDLTQSCGIFFYLVTGQWPVTLLARIMHV